MKNVHLQTAQGAGHKAQGRKIEARIAAGACVAIPHRYSERAPHELYRVFIKAADI
jgi:hypothetical protein